MSIDTNTTGNSATALGPRDECKQVAAGSTVTIDVTIEGVPPYVDNPPLGVVDASDLGGIVSFTYELGFSASVTVSTADHNFLLGNNPGTNIFDASNSLPDSASPWIGTVLDTGTGVPESGSGVLSRLTLTLDPGFPEGVWVVLTLTNHAHGDASGNFYTPNTTNNAILPVNAPCPTVIVDPTWTPTPSPQ